jgi:hypothetical protein
MSAPRIFKELAIAAEIFERSKDDLAKLQGKALPHKTGRVETVAEPVVEHILEYVSNLDDSQVDELHEMYVFRSGDEE